jgi:hypothetical protein
MAMVAQIRLAAASAPVALFPWLAPQATSTFKLIHPATARRSIHSSVRPVCARVQGYRSLGSSRTYIGIVCSHSFTRSRASPPTLAARTDLEARQLRAPRPRPVPRR